MDVFHNFRLNHADKNHNPRKGTETVFEQRFIEIIKCDKNHNPRKGTETVASQSTNRRIMIGDKNHNPRKGTETSTM